MKSRIRKIIGLLLIAGAAVCGIIAYRQYSMYKDGNEEYQLLADESTEDNNLPGEDPDAFTIDWASLFAQNPDLVGWIQMEPTVNYPVVKGTDNHFYLKHGFGGEYNINGCIFMNYLNSSDWGDRNTILYGHNMNNGSMFGNNDYYNDRAYTKEHSCFYIYTPDGMYTYRIFDTITSPDAADPYTIDLGTEAAFSDYLEKMNQMKDYGMDVKVSTQDRIVTLSTCTPNGKRRFIIQGVMESFTDNEKKVFSVQELREKESQAAAESAACAEQP